MFLKHLHLCSAFIERGLQIVNHSRTHARMHTARCWPDQLEQFEVQFLVQGHRRTQRGVGDETILPKVTKILLFYHKRQLQDSSVLDLGQAPCQSTARWCLRSPVNWRVEPLQETLKYLSDRRWWHLLSSADMPSRNGIQGQLMLLPRFFSPEVFQLP